MRKKNVIFTPIREQFLAFTMTRSTAVHRSTSHANQSFFVRLRQPFCLRTFLWTGLLLHLIDTLSYKSCYSLIAQGTIRWPVSV